MENERKIRLLIIDDSPSLVNAVKKYFKNNDIIEVALTAKDGNEGIEIINTMSSFYDLILLDIFMPKIDGIGVLKYLKNNNINKRIIVLTANRSEKVLEKVSKYEIDYIMLKPIIMEQLDETIKEVMTEENKSTDNKYQSIIKTLHELGVPSNIKGYKYIKEAISLMISNPNMEEKVTKYLYPTIAEKYNASTSSVERSIRHAIEISWNRANIDLMEEIFGYSIDIEKAKPTNSEYISTIAETLRTNHF